MRRLTSTPWINTYPPAGIINEMRCTLWELPEVTTVANAVCQANRFRHRRNLRQLPQGYGVSFKAHDVSES